MDHVRDNKIIQIFFFIIVAALGVFLYSKGPEKPQVNTFNYIDTNFFIEDTNKTMLDQGFVVNSLEVRRLKESKSVIEVVVDSHVLDTCTTLVEKSNIYTNRIFNIELELSKKINAICLGGKTGLTTIIPIDLGQLSEGLYKIKIQNKSASFDIEEIMKKAATTTDETIEFFMTDEIVF